MNRSTLAAAVLLAPMSFAAAPCTREGLQKVAGLYIESQSNGSRLGRGPQSMIGLAPGALPIAMRLGYVENFEDGIGERLIENPMEIRHHLSLLDSTRCETYTELIGSMEGKPYAVGTRLRVTGDTTAVEIEMVWATNGHQQFDAEQFVQAAAQEHWSSIPAAQRDTRKMLQSVADSYLDALLLGRADVPPWGAACARPCRVGLPVPAVNIANRHYVIDETMGAVVVYCTWGADPKSGRIRTPDAHLFRVESGKVRYVHAITHLL